MACMRKRKKWLLKPNLIQKQGSEFRRILKNKCDLAILKWHFSTIGNKIEDRCHYFCMYHSFIVLLCYLPLSCVSKLFRLRLNDESLWNCLNHAI